MNRIGIRVIVSSKFTSGFFERLYKVCSQYDMRITEESCVPYWKIEGFDEIGVTADRVPMLTLPEWRAVFEELFHHTDYIIEWGPGGYYALSFNRYTTPEETQRLDEENYFVIMCMTEACLKHQ